MAKILGRQTIIDSLKAGARIQGDPIWGYTLRKPTVARPWALPPHTVELAWYDGWVVGGDILSDLLREGLISQERTGGSQYYIYYWKENAVDNVLNRKFTCANIVFETKMGGLLYYCGKRRPEYPDNCNECSKYKPMKLSNVLAR